MESVSYRTWRCCRSHRTIHLAHSRTIRAHPFVTLRQSTSAQLIGRIYFPPESTLSVIG